MTFSSLRSIVAALFAGMIVAACATSGPVSNARDPWEGLNRAVFDFNQAADQAVVGPFIDGYRVAFPDDFRQSVSNLVLNLREPLTFGNEIVQAKPGEAATTLARFLINSTLGIGGLFNIAGDMGITRTSEDIGQTLAVWGIGDGPYMMIPFLGPSNMRDTAGFIGAIFADPANIGLSQINDDWLVLAHVGVDALDTRSRLHTTLNALYRENDPYVFARSAYFQQRRFAICDGRCPEDDEEEDLFDDFDEDVEWEDAGDGDSDAGGQP